LGITGRAALENTQSEQKDLVLGTETAPPTTDEQKIFTSNLHIASCSQSKGCWDMGSAAS
jgi:hypothetical protein